MCFLCNVSGSWIMMRHVSCILLLEWSTTSQRLWVYRISVPYAQKDPRFLFEKRRGQPREFWSLVSTIDGSTLPQNMKLLEKHTIKKKKFTYEPVNIHKYSFSYSMSHVFVYCHRVLYIVNMATGVPPSL